MDKVSVKNALVQKMESLQLSGNKVAPLIGISSANVSNILNDKWDIVGDQIWRKVMVYCGMASKWQPAKTANLAKIYALCQDAQSNHVALAFSFAPGSGKSFALKHYTATTKEVAYVECDEYWTKKIFLQKIGSSLGVTVEGTVHEMVETVVEVLNRKRNPLLIIDEADKLKDPALNMFKTLFNRTQERCGFILCGAPYFKIRIEKGVSRNKQAYQEIYSRLGGEFIPLTPVSSNDVGAVCKANDVSNPEHISAIIGASKGDLRQVARMIHKLKKDENYNANE
ncbi:MAG: hypothetical protein CVU43_12550 [Chloroflexi bacterium HGW-Chloroflexi-5]|jgi:DNA transposition AAA+ family ATPase|nr:MAG: hypothetical protein CVU43_12550 [Chloroflexi bacterium HGW-Chloroflexi-5]PKP09838.1 MAG: hypothetical protein CVU09_09420 [Bacteroidetes bacterium HGW-Bacteroidetes-4]